MSGHTPGRWRVDRHNGEWFNVESDAYGAFTVCEAIHTTDDADLIAAAPELLEALRAGPDAHSVEAVSGKCVAPCFGCLRRTAIAQAEGRS